MNRLSCLCSWRDSSRMYIGLEGMYIRYHTYIVSYLPSSDVHEVGRGSLRASGSLLVFGGTSLTSALSGWAGAFISTTTHQPRFVDRTKGRGHTCRKKLCWSNMIQNQWREWRKTCYRSMNKMLGCWSWSCCRSTMIVEHWLKSARHTSGWGGVGWMGGRTTLLLKFVSSIDKIE